MNGATALDSVKIINSPNRSSKITIGKSHHFLRVFKKSHSSFKIDIVPIVMSPVFGHEFVISFQLSAFGYQLSTER